MKAVRLNDWGKAVVLEDVPQPQPKDDEVLIRVHAASINPFDAALQAGYLQGMASVPLTMGTDFAGDVVSAGSQIIHLRPGDAVYGLSPLGSGAFAEYITVKAHEATHKPHSLDFVTSAAAPLPAMAAWKSLFELLEVKRGERLLIHGAAGNVGGIATQLAKAEGVFVYGTDIPEKAEHGHKLGIDQFISTNEWFEDIVKDVDAVLDLVGGELMNRSYNVLKPGGRYVTSLLGETPQDEPQRRGIRSMGLAAWPNAEVLMKMAERIDAGKIQVFVNRTFPLEEANAAMAYRLQTTAPGKIVLTVL
ncbi:MAG: NADP-dependent oxidoreductase [Chloroflexi bacterium]|nr:MAG: NADP-dependent oxidoreductase [Chloroflexota bacterium]